MAVTAAELLIKIRAIVDGSRSIDEVRAGLAGLDDAAKQGATGTDGLSASLKKLGGVLVGVFALGQVQQFASTLSGLSDEYTRLIGKLNLSTDSSEEQARVYTVLRDIADQVGVQTSELVTTFSRLKTATEGAGGRTSQLLDITESLAKALAVGGASTAEAASVLRQFGQAMASGVLRGDEFNSLMENAAPLMSAVADSLGTTTGALRALAEAGQLSITKIANAILAQGTAIDEQFSKLPTSIEQSVQRVSNAFLDFVGKADQASGASRALVGIITAVAGNFESLATGALALAGLAAAKLAQSLVTTVAASSAAATAATATAAAQAAAARTAAANAAAQAAVARAVLAAEIANHKLAASLGVSSAATLANVQAARASAAAYATQAAALAPATASVSAAAVAAKLFNGSLLLLASAVGGFSLGNLLNEFESVRATAVGVVGAFDKVVAGASLLANLLTDPGNAAQSWKDYEQAVKLADAAVSAATRKIIDSTRANKEGRSEVERFTETVAKHAQRQVEAAGVASAAIKSVANLQIAVSEQAVAAAKTEQDVALAGLALALSRANALQRVAEAAQDEAEAAQAVTQALVDEAKARGKITELNQAAIDASKADANAKNEQAAKAQAAAAAAAKLAQEQIKSQEPARVAAELSARLAAKRAEEKSSTDELAEIEAKITVERLRNAGLTVAAADAEASSLRASVASKKEVAAAALDALAAAEKELAVAVAQAPVASARTEAEREHIEALESKADALKKSEAQARLEVESAQASAAAADAQTAANTKAAVAIQARTAAEKAQADAAGKGALEVQALANATQDAAKQQELQSIATEKSAAENNEFLGSIRSVSAAIAQYIDGVGRAALAQAQQAGAVDVSAGAFDRLYKSILSGINAAQQAGNFSDLFRNIQEAALAAERQAQGQQQAYEQLFQQIDSGQLSMRELADAQKLVESSAVEVNHAHLGIVRGLGLIDQQRLDGLISQINAAKDAMLSLLAATEDQIFAEEQRRRILQGDDTAAKAAEFARKEAELRKQIAATQDSDLRLSLQRRLDLLRENNDLELRQLRDKERERAKIEREAEAERKQRETERTAETPPREPNADKPLSPRPETSTPERPRPNIRAEAEEEDRLREELHQRQLARIEQQRKALESLRAQPLAFKLGALTADELITPETVRRLVEPVLRERARLRG